MSEADNVCAECGMTVRANEYHPYAACLMFKACDNGDTVRANLNAIEAHVREELAAICEAHGNERLIIRPMSINDDPWKVGVFDCVELLRGDYKL